MNKRFLLIAACLILLSTGKTFSQTSNVAYFMKLPQSHFLNPAFKPVNRFYLGLPVISGINIGLENNFISLSDIFVPGLKADSIFTFQNPDFSLSALASKLNKKNTIATDASIQIFGLALPVGKNFTLMVDITDRFSGKILFPRELLDLYLTGGSDIIGKPINISEMNVKAQFYREYAAGVSGDIIPNLRVGARVKILSGIGSLSFDNRAFSLTVNNDLSQTVSADATMETAGRGTLNTIFNNSSSKALDPVKGYLTAPFRNPGFALDAGATYSFGRLITVSAAVKDLGFIKWKDGLNSWNANGTFSLPGITLQDVQNQSFSVDEMFGKLVDSVKANFRQVNSPSAFTTKLPGQFILGASFNPFKFLSLGVLSVSKAWAGSMNENITLSANTYLGRTFAATLAYTIANDSYNNIGFGLAFKAGVAQIYMIADKIPVQWNKVYFPKSGGGYSGIPMPENFNKLSFQVGMNIVFGKQVAPKNDKPAVQTTGTEKK